MSVGAMGYEGAMSTPSAPETVLPPHLEQAPALSTVPDEKPAPAPKVHRLAPIHLHVLRDASEKAQALIGNAERLVAGSLGVSGQFEVTRDPSGALVLVEQPS